MADALAKTKTRREIGSLRVAAVDRLLIEGIKVGPICKQRAINKILREVPGITRGDCWQRIRYLRKTGKLATTRPDPPAVKSAASPKRRGISWRRWTEEEDDKLLNWAGYEPVEKIAHRLGRTERAVRFRLSALGMSGKLTDGWSLRELRKLLRISPERLRQLIGSGKLRVRDSRITAESLRRFRGANRAPGIPANAEGITGTGGKNCDGYMWERAAELLGIEVMQIQVLISTGQLKLMDTFVTDRSFEEFCRTYGHEINLGLMDPGTAKWLIEEYGVSPRADEPRSIPRAQKHALVVRTCKCGRKIAGNVFFKHVKACKVVAFQAPRQPSYDSGLRSAAGGST